MGSYNELLRKVSFFDGLEEETLTQLSGCLKPMDFSKDALVVGQDDPGDAMFIIERGRVKVVLYGETGREMILSIFRAGDVVGEMSLLDGQPRSANVIAVEESRLLSLSRRDFVELLKTEPAIALNVLEEMSIRLRRADDIIGNLALLDVYGRVARVLVDMAERDGEDTDEGIMIKERPTQQDLASMIGTSRETVSRVLSEFQRRGFLSMQGKKILLSHGFAEEEVFATHS
ncbi:MAG: Crp/Fnr family transcriptional regulator [Myxococcota bacterium]